MSMLFVKGFFLVNFELLVLFCHGLSNREFVRFKDLGLMYLEF